MTCTCNKQPNSEHAEVCPAYPPGGYPSPYVYFGQPGPAIPAMTIEEQDIAARRLRAHGWHVVRLRRGAPNV